ncbi:LURP-one-related/scramblase family protein [Georgenia sp. Z1491]|uniref:LURP-one-related/scramblase family protein n=1 Tax=Georgenia sp. Z1491 TaxID=3416707 RepID=UPI003CEA27CA
MESYLESLAPRLRAALARVFHELVAGREPGTVPGAAVVHSSGRSWVPVLTPATAPGSDTTVDTAPGTSTDAHSSTDARAHWWAAGWPAVDTPASAELRAIETELDHWARTNVTDAEREEWEFQLFAALGSALGSPEVRGELGPTPVLLVTDRRSAPHLSVVSLQMLNEDHPHPDRVAEALTFWSTDPEPLPEETVDPAPAADGTAVATAGTWEAAAAGHGPTTTPDDAASPVDHAHVDGAPASGGRSTALLEQDVVVMHQVTSFLSNDFDILDEHEQVVGHVRTTGSSMFGSRSFEVADADDTLLMHVVDTLAWGSDRYTLTDPDGSPLAEVVQRMAFFSTRVEIAVTDGPLLEIGGRGFDQDFEILDGERPLGAVSRQPAGFFSGKDRYVIRLEDDAGPRERLALIGGTLALDLIRAKKG